jgi:hypothetical protein
MSAEPAASPSSRERRATSGATPPPAPVPPPGAPPQVMRGRLRDYALADLVQFLHALRKSGHLLVERREPAMAAGLYFVSGAIVHAYCGEVAGEAAVAALLRWDDGRFVFVAGARPDRCTVQADVGTLLLDGLRQKDELAAALQRLPPADTAPHRRRDRAEIGDRLLTWDEWRLFARLDGRRTVGDLLRSDPDGEVVAARRLAGLFERGLACQEEPRAHLDAVVLAREAQATLTGPLGVLLTHLDGLTPLAGLANATGLTGHELAEAARTLVEARLARVVDGHDAYARCIA